MAKSKLQKQQEAQQRQLLSNIKSIIENFLKEKCHGTHKSFNALNKAYSEALFVNFNQLIIDDNVDIDNLFDKFIYKTLADNLLVAFLKDNSVESLIGVFKNKN